MIEVYSQIVDENRWGNLKTEEMVRLAVELVDNTHDIENKKQISVVFTTNNKVQELNRDYRNKDKTTNILSFAFNDDGSDNIMLGELFIAYDVIADEASSQGKSFYNHLMHIIIHGVLHLLGYDHIEDGDAEEMEVLEVELLKKIDIENPYKEGDN